MSKVVKFGGSSLASAEQFKKVGNIIRADKERKYVVPSAPGKRFSDDTKVTDMLYACYDLADQGKNFKAELDAIKARYQEIIDGLQLDLDLVDEFKTIEKNFKAKAGSNYAASRGEYLNGIIMANYLGYDFIDAATVIFFDENGEFDAAKTNEVLRARLAESKEAVVPGFYGAMPDGTVKTFSRGGSDITGSIVAKAAKADVYENWTDVSGFLIADPRIIDHPEAIETIPYRELRELAYMGATVLHEDAIFPVRQEGIPINIRNTNAPEDNGTWIVGSTCQKSKYVITGIAGKKVDMTKRITIGTKYPRIARSYFEANHHSVDIIKLNGSVELAPIVGLSDVIVDIVETGNTLNANGLEVLKYFMDFSARMICNPVSFKMKYNEIQQLMDVIREHSMKA